MGDDSVSTGKVIDWQTGGIRLSDDLIVSPATTIEQLRAHFGKGRLEFRDRGHGVTRCAIWNVTIDDQYFLFRFTFLSQGLKFVDFIFDPQQIKNRSWADWSETEEEANKEKYDRWLGREIEQGRAFEWGAARVYCDRIGLGSRITLMYESDRALLASFLDDSPGGSFWNVYHLALKRQNPSIEKVIDAQTGNLRLADNFIVSEATTPEQLVAYFGKDRLRFRDAQTGWTHYTIQNLRLDDGYFTFCFTFDKGTLDKIAFLFYDEPVTGGWENYNERTERVNEKKFDEWLTSQVGRGRRFGWGTLAAQYDERSGGSEIYLNYLPGCISFLEGCSFGVFNLIDQIGRLFEPKQEQSSSRS